MPNHPPIRQSPISSVRGAGLGLRRAHLGSLVDRIPSAIDFMEVAPENWIGVGGRLGHALREVTARVPVVAHGLSLNLGGPDPLDEAFLLQLKAFLATHGCPLYSEHLSYCADRGHLYELLPCPFTMEAARHMAARIRRVQEVLEQRIAVENVSYYCAPGQEIPEPDFLRLVLAEADCALLLDINNIYVNSVNHGYDPVALLHSLPGERIAYAHMAGHLRVAPGLLIDTHGAPAIPDVWSLLEAAYDRFGPFPTLIERDQNIPPLADLLPEVQRIRTLQAHLAAWPGTSPDAPPDTAPDTAPVVHAHAG